MFNIELIRKMFIYEHTRNKKFEMTDLKQLLRLDNNFINQNKFKEWIDEQNLIGELRIWLKEHDLEKTFPDVYVVGKTNAEEFVDFLYDYSAGISKENQSKIIKDFLNKAKKRNKDMFE